MKTTRRTLLCASAAGCAALMSAPLRAQTYPSKPIRLVVPFAPGGNIDVAARALAPALEAVLKQPLVIDNRPGAGGAIGMAMTTGAAADGYTLVLGVPSMVTTLPLIQSAQYTMADVAPVSLVSQTSVVLVTRKSDARFGSLADLAALSRKQPGALSAGHPSPGSPNHLALLQTETAVGSSFNVIPYKGSAPALVDLIGGQLDMYFDQLPSALPYIKSGQLRALAVCSLSPDQMLPDVKTVGQQGLRGFDATTYAGVFAPAKTPAQVLDTLEQAIAQATRDERMQSVLRNLGSTAKSSTQRDFAQLLQAEASLAKRFLAEGRLKKDA
ncbi:MAG: tripartite tricarboxylate transporter substrate binding protein [Proteobacteria bacterium]|nr:tripartite tricarboxylate transporter substrate binding protein [Pseudomonadota bacterium]